MTVLSRSRTWKLILMVLTAPVAPFGLYGQAAHTNWSKLSKYLVIQPSLNISAWENRSFVTQMTPVGDGTYQVRMNLTPGQVYNYVFMAKSSLQPPPGVSPDYTYYDQPPSTGGIPTSRNPSTVEATNQAWYASVTSAGDARRVILVPDLASGEELYVFNNFNASPKLPDRIEALAGDGKVTLSWSLPRAAWNWEDVNVLSGGKFYLYFNSSGPTNNYALLASLEGNVTSYTHTGLVNNTVYYYVLVVADAYLQAPGLPFENKKTALPPPSGKASSQASATPRGTMPVYFKVEKMDWDVVAKGRFLVWLTPEGQDGRTYFNKTAGRIIRVEVKE